MYKLLITARGLSKCSNCSIRRGASRDVQIVECGEGPVGMCKLLNTAVGGRGKRLSKCSNCSIRRGPVEVCKLLGTAGMGQLWNVHVAEDYGKPVEQCNVDVSICFSCVS